MKNTFKIFIVEDDRMYQKMLTHILEPDKSSKENEVARKRPKLGQIGRKVTRHNLISRQDTLNLVPNKPSASLASGRPCVREQAPQAGAIPSARVASGPFWAKAPHRIPRQRHHHRRCITQSQPTL